MAGGVKGTRQMRADCPACGRDTAGGFWGYGNSSVRIILHKHKRNVGEPAVRREWCPGSTTVVDRRA